MLERPLRPGEVSLDDLERAFRETEAEVAPPVARCRSAPRRLRSGRPARRKSRAEEDATEPETAEGDRVANQSIRVNVDTLEHLMTMVSELVLTRNQLLEIVGRTRTPNSRCRCSGCPTSPPSCRKA